MDVAYILRFTPEAETDYKYNLVCVTERETFLVPIEAIGARAVLDFPDELVFTDAPVKFDTTRTLLVRNIGNRPAKFHIKTEPPFHVSPTNGYLDLKQSMQIDVVFHPEQSGSFKQDLCVCFDTGEEIYVSLMGSAENAHIRLEKPTLKLDSTYITLASIKTVKIFNRSDIMAKFQWKRFADSTEEAQYRMRRNAELLCYEEEEKGRSQEIASGERIGDSVDLALLAQKYKNQKREIDNDPLLFEDAIFRVEPTDGIVWPKSFVEVNVFFEPTTPGVHSQTIYCDVAGRDIRLPLQLKGEGVGPKARFSYDMLDLEDIYIDTVHKYEVILENLGDIDVIFSLRPSGSLFGPKFSFIPESGVIGVGEQQAINIVFHPDILGSFIEEFTWNLQGSAEPIILGFKGQVVGPNFHFDLAELDYQKVAYGFESVRAVTLVNTSQIPMSFHLRVSANETEFAIEPSRGVIPPTASQKIHVAFTPTSVQQYDTHIIVDVPGVSDDMCRLSVFAQSVVPEIKLHSFALEYGDCFLNYLYDGYVLLENPTDFPARYKLQLQEESAKAVFQYSSRNAIGVIEPHSETKINLEIQIKRLGQINFPIFLTISGNEEIPVVVDITANGIGPSVVVSTTELNWGKIPVLKDVPMSLSLKNDSPIAAHFSCNAVSDQSVYRVSPSEGWVSPQAEVDLEVTAFLDDALKFTDIIKIATHSGGVHEVHLVARGQGTTIVFDKSLEEVHFDDVFSSRECSRDFTLVNKGRRSQTLIWSVEEKRSKDANGIWEPVFEVIPSRFTLKPNGQQVITIKGYSSKAIEVSETLVCQGFIDKDPTRRQILTTLVSANFITPLMKLTPPSLKFFAAHERDEDCTVLTQKLQLKNTSPLPLHVFFKCPSSYTVNPPQLENALNPGDTSVVTVTYDPSFHTDRVTVKEHAKLVIRYAEHPQKDIVEMYSEVTFPNLSFGAMSMDYGCIPINTEQKKTLVMTNCSVLPVSYSWLFHAPAFQTTLQDESELSDVLIDQIFDIRPLHGMLMPGDSETVEITFYGHLGGRFSAVAICDVAGGPKYEISLQGEVSLIEYQFDRHVIDFGTQSYQDILEQDLILTNMGRVSFDFNTLLLAESPLQQKIAIFPAAGTIGPRTKQRLAVRCCFAVPETVDDYFFVQIAQFEPVKIQVTGAGTFPRLSLNIPRMPDERYDAHLAEVKSACTKKAKQNLASDNAPGKFPDPEAEAQAERLLLKERTLDLLARLNDDIRTRMPPVPRGKYSVVSLSESSQVKLASYICDFGNVIRNTQKKKTVRLKNTGLHPISFTIDKSVLTGTGFSVEPDKVRLLPGAPHHECIDIQITFQARNMSINMDLGTVGVDLPVKIAGGPSIDLALRAYVTVPDLTISTNEIDFGEVLCGYRKTVMVRLHNSYTVPCEWTVVTTDVVPVPTKKKVKKKLGAQVIREFDFIPSSGILQPGEKIMMMVHFVPMEDRIYDETFPIKITMNAKAAQLRVTGKGIQPSIIFEPEALIMGPVLPFSDGAVRKFIAYNPTDYPLEMYSLEFDQQYLEEEELLKHLDGWYQNGVLYIPPREPGGGLPEPIVEAALAKIKQERNGKEPMPSDTGVGDLVETLPVGGSLQQSRFAKSSTALSHLPTGTTHANESSTVSTPDVPVNIILHGPPFAGRKTQARRISKTFGYVYVRVDEMIDVHLGAEGSGHDIASRLKEALSGVHAENISGGAGGAKVLVSASVAADADDHYPFSATPALERDDGESPQRDHYHTGDTQFSLSEDLIADIIRVGLQKEDCTRGIVFDGLESKYGTPLVIMRAIMRGNPERSRKPLLFNLAADVLHIREREGSAHRGGGDKDADALHVEEVSEADYDNMTEQEKEKYDHLIAKYRRRLKEQQDRKKVEHRHWEDELAIRLERKAEEEKAKAKKGARRPPISTRPIDKPDKTAPSPGSKSDARLSRNNLSIGEVKTDAMSPKVIKRLALDKIERGSEKGTRSELGERIDKDAFDDLSSRFTLSEGGDLFLNESTYRRVDNYSSTLEAVINLLKDGDRPVPGRQLAGTVQAEKKAPKTKIGAGGTVPPDVAAASGVLSTSEGEQHGAEESMARYYVEINANLDEDTVFKTITEHLPTQSKAEEGVDVFDRMPEPYIEQIMSLPPERADVAPHLKYFSLFAPAAIESEDDALPLTEVVPSLPAATTPATGAVASTSSNTGARTDNGRRARPVVKVNEDVKLAVESDDDIDKDEIRRFRWVIQPHERKELFVKFSAAEVGKFEQTLNFELVGAKGRYSIHCAGYCQYAQIAGDPKKIFQKWRKTKDDKAIVHGEYIASTGTYDFGPLLYSKPREKYLDRYPENRALLNITNPGKSEIKVAFGLRNDVKGDVFFFEPQSMDLSVGQTETLSIWAYPRNTNHVEDLFVICVKDNPEPYSFKLTCTGVKPELEIDKKSLTFDKLLLGKMERRELRLRNNTLLPVAWKLAGADALGDEFQVGPVEGVLDPAQECTIAADFKGNKPVVVKKLVRLEVSDTDRIAGVVQEVPILVTAEAYDIAVDLHFPKGYEGGLDFGVIKVFEEGKQMCTLRNKGKYEVGYRFAFDSKECSDLFTVSPQQGVIQPSDKPFQVQLVFRSGRELTIRDSTSCKCQFFEPVTGEVTATIPVKLSARAVFSKFSILPVRDLNFGALVHGTKATRQFIIENLGEFDFRYSIYKLVAALTDNKLGGKTRTNSRASKTGGRATSPPSSKIMSRKDVIKQGDTLNFGAFAIFPTSGVVSAGQKQPITVEFHSETPGSFEEIAAIDISDRSPSEYPDVLEYRLIGESCIPGINTSDYASIFEEHTLCKRLELFSSQTSYYAEDDRIFYFGPYLVGQQAQVRFKLSNPYKIPCDVTISTRPRTKARGEAADFAFDSEPKRLSIPSHESRYITVTFHPMLIQSYAGIFEAVVENVAESKTKTLSFELRGEGTLPRITVDRPSLRNKAGIPLLHFRRLLIGASQTLPIVLRNDGIIAAKVKLEWNAKDTDDFDCAGLNQTYTLKPQESRSYDVRCRASAARKLDAELRVRVIDNTFEDTSIQLSGEGYLDELSFDGLPNDSENELFFGDCFVNEPKQIAFSVTNHSHEYLRIAFGDHDDFSFSPSCLHIRPKGSKEVTASFLARHPNEHVGVHVPVKVAKIKYESQPPDADWDDSMKAVRWVMTDLSRVMTPKKIVEQHPEPAVEILGHILPDRTLLLSGFAEFSSYECDVTNVRFKDTMMYQTRIYIFTVRNTGKVRLPYTFTFIDDDNSPLDPDSVDCPFSVLPSSGTIEGGETASFTLRFSPVEVGTYTAKLVSSMSNLAAGQKAMQLHIQGSSQRPFCHFEIEESDYLVRRNMDLTSVAAITKVLDPGTKVIEFFSYGVKIRNTKRFYLVNPTNISYSFEWVHEAGDERMFKCLTPRGLVTANKKYEIVFEFTPESIDLKESLWRFNIVGHKLSVSFLLVGQAMEPNVFMDRPSVNFKSVLVGRQVKEIVKLVNNEAVPFSFCFNDTSFEMNNDGVPVLRFSPTAGTIAAKSEAAIEITFVPSAEKMFNYNLLCNVRKKPSPLSINVKGEGYEIHDSLQSELPDGALADLISGPTAENVVDFGMVQLNEKRLRRIAIINSGRFNFDFNWKLQGKRSGALCITPETGIVRKGERMVCDVSFLPTQVVSLKEAKATCHILNGRSYQIAFRGSGVRPLLKLSKVLHDFGTHFVYKAGMNPATTTIELTNEDVNDILFDILPLDSAVFDVKRVASTLPPGQTTPLEISFYPRDSVAYTEIIKIEINGLSTVDFIVKGNGTEFRVEPLHAEQRTLNFGAARVGHAVSRTMKLVNHSTIPANFNIGPPSALESLAAHSVELSPRGSCTLRPRGTLNVDVRFHPQSRIPAFSEEICLEAPGISKSLAIVSGACQGTEVRLENETLPFGAVVYHSTAARRVQMQNVGDIGATFHWDVSKFAPDFTISPSEGYISPGMEIALEITFRPTELNPDIRYENLTCHVEGIPPLYLTLTGMCIPPPVQNEVLKFAAPVRQSDTKSISLSNRTSTYWHVRPIIENDFWSGPEIIDIEPGQSKSYDITFTPLVMTGDGDGGRHEGSIFFPLPDGTGMLYKLYGTADKPVAAGNITRDVPSKTQFTEILSVTNWLKKPQRLKVIIEQAKPDPSVILKGHDFIDLPSLLSKDYKLSFYAYKEGVTGARIIFKNEATQEFTFFNVTFRSTSPGVISTIELATTVRQATTKDIVLANPLAVPVAFNVSCNYPDITVPHSLVVQPRAESICTIEFLPLQPRESTARLAISSSELGVYQYDLKLIANPAGPERSLHFKVGLGGSQVQSFRFVSFAKAKTEYTCKIDSADFFTEKTILVPAATNSGCEVCIDVTYEPSRLGDTRTQLIVSSPTGGDYICPLFGHCISPRPQGPVSIKPGVPASLPFKNIFNSSATFNFIVDNPAFAVKAAETIGPKKTIQVSIAFKPPSGVPYTPNAEKGEKEEATAPPASRRERSERAKDTAAAIAPTTTPAKTVTGPISKVGKLMISHGESNVVWIYYLRAAAS
ncbi:uncharacterized protein SPPG_07904 [Spizellomyces punctatus DAOM BR117]|uniref:MSP domain-containing protein n=1 Tax=Spizellomyces punctatus (strain DAOM BR117) TaxID=645134 RepID=A0A0L0H746_SPIPD|nr:uncharacterized protein SPPG_07904 [Spizellomyces punctatus DAOM BR117]KNC96691.1 hypothetical protein SPPG_07904 [Spizellomyces punctatus DAOM BR117]|eukprot:XP_016604731.1 hypothetical protein SPPG_07904 [Spizellomyces punctatus DAOM BR117]